MVIQGGHSRHMGISLTVERRRHNQIMTQVYLSTVISKNYEAKDQDVIRPFLRGQE